MADRLANGEAISLIVDSTGMSFGRASDWHRQKYRRDASRTPWRKVHLSIDPEMNIHAIAVTEDKVSDEAGLDVVLTVDAPVDCVIADGAYYSIAQTEAWSACGVLPVIPPPANAVVHDQRTTRWHDQIAATSKRNPQGIGANQEHAHAPAASSLPRAIHRLDSANKITSCAVFFLSPR
ncbi:hypothetical protein J2785_007423 [Burkholderia ambifaria]|nr:transposase [Burkholderia ambifaria]MDR6504225.1 hypothetical protein [Burkholderia ambifaria]